MYTHELLSHKLLCLWLKIKQFGNFSRQSTYQVNSTKFLGVHIADDITLSATPLPSPKKPSSALISADSCSAADRKTLQWVVRAAEKIIGAPLPGMADLYEDRCVKKATNMDYWTSLTRPTTSLCSWPLVGGCRESRPGPPDCVRVSSLRPWGHWTLLKAAPYPSCQGLNELKLNCTLHLQPDAKYGTHAALCCLIVSLCFYMSSMPL